MVVKLSYAMENENCDCSHGKGKEKKVLRETKVVVSLGPNGGPAVGRRGTTGRGEQARIDKSETTF